MNYSDRRRHPRFEGQFKVDLLNMGDDPNIAVAEAVVPAVALDVSRQGLRLKTVYSVPVGTLLSAIVYFRGVGSVCLCQVVWKREEMGEFCYGLFIEEWPQMDNALNNALKSIENQEHEASHPAAPSAPAVVTSFQLA